MAATGGQIRGKVAAFQKVFTRGLYAVIDGISAANQPKDAARFEIVTGGDGIIDIPAVAGTYVLFPAADVPQGLAFDVVGLAAYVTSTVAWAGGTAGTVSVTIQGTDGTPIATFTQAALTGSPNSQTPTTYSISAGSTLASGVVDYAVRTIGASLARGIGIQVVVANSTSGSPLRLRLNGNFVPA